MAAILKRFRKKKEAAQKEQVAVKNRIFNVNDGLVTDKYLFKHVLGKGSFSTVRQGTHKAAGEEVAIKIIDKNSIDIKVESLKTEVRILMNVKHPNIVNLLDVYEDDDKVYLIMELMTGGELFDRICNDYPNGYSEQQSAEIIRKIITAVKYLHDRGIIHRDLKPENLLFATREDNAEIRISDFGLAKIMSGDMLVKTACGSPNYVAPEVLMNELHGYNDACDMWSVGVILYVLLCGFCPFFDECTPALFQAITTGNYSFPSPFWDRISEQAKDLIRHLLIVEPRNRYSPQQALSHPWLTTNQCADAIPDITQNIRKFANDRRKASFVLESQE